MCDGTPCPCNLEPKPKRSPDPRTSAVAALLLVGPVLASGIVTAASDPRTGAVCLLSLWLVGLCAAVARTLGRGRG